MVTLQMMQFTAVVLMALLTVKLLFLRERRIKSRPSRLGERCRCPALRLHRPHRTSANL